MVEQESTSQVWRILLATLGVAGVLLALTVTRPPFNFWVFLIGIAFVLTSLTAK
jgi:hypothetical protein